MRISRVHAPVTVLGPGQRVGVWVQGCTLACPGCASRDTWDPAGGREVTTADLLGTVAELGASCTGLTISGGEPLQQPLALADLLQAVRADPRTRGWDVLVFTGLLPEEWDADQRAALERADAAVVGRYRAGEAGAEWLRASANQRLLTLTDIGRQRFVDPHGAGGGLQVVVDEDGLTMIGLPRPGDLGRMERELHRRGVTLTGVSWRS